MQLIILILATSTAFSSLLYELVLSQLLAALLGDTLTYYATTIAVYLTAMGLGAFAVNENRGSPERRFLNLQLMLSLLGALSPVSLVWISKLSSDLRQAEVLQLIFSYSATFFIGYLSGKELPLLMKIAEMRDGGKALSSRVLALDYVGMLLATLLFPLLLLPLLGVILTGVLAAGLNLAGALLWKKSLKYARS